MKSLIRITVTDEIPLTPNSHWLQLIVTTRKKYQAVFTGIRLTDLLLCSGDFIDQVESHLLAHTNIKTRAKMEKNITLKWPKSVTPKNVKLISYNVLEKE